MLLVLIKIFSIFVAFLAGLVGICVFRALLWHKSLIIDYSNPNEKDLISDISGPLKRFSEALKFRTISYSPHNYEREALSDFIKYISTSFPLVHSSPLVSREVVNNLSLLYHVQGSNKDLKPYMLTGHMDVVPVEESKWTVEPFAGKVSDGYLWGRGTMDCKNLVMGTLEALEFLLSKGYQPKRSFYLGFGHDEEVDGEDGAQYISKLLQSRNVKLEYILDEGTLVIDNFRGISGPVALVGISEKGSLHLELTVNEAPGHSSLPSRETAITILSSAVSKLKGDVFPSMFGKGPEKQMLEGMAYSDITKLLGVHIIMKPSASFPLKVLLGNIWLFRPLIIRFMSSPEMNAFHRTTTAVTLIKGGTKSNVLPSSASATVNLRIHPAQTIEEVLKYLKKVINDDRVELSVLSAIKPHPVSPVDSFGYLTIKKSVRQIYNDSTVVPCTLIANTDTIWYLNLTDFIYRFAVTRVGLSDLKRIHGIDERIGEKNYMELVNFYVHLIKNSDEAVKPKHIHTDL